MPRPADAMAFIRVVGDLRIDPRDGRQPIVRGNVEVGTGSGFVIAASGLLLTSRHVVETESRERGDGPELTLENRRILVYVGGAGSAGEWEAHVLAADAESDLAALQLTAAELPYLPLGDSDAVEAGRPVQVLGFPFGRQTEVAKPADSAVIPQVTVTAGSLSAAREDEQGDTRFLQTDAVMLPGNSGGPMLDEGGYVVGVVRMKLSADATSQGAGFTVPVNVVKDFLEANGLLDRLPVTRLSPGVRHTIDWKAVAVELPDGLRDRSPARVAIEAGEIGEIDFRVDRWATPWPVAGLEEALLGGSAVPGFVPGPASAGRRTPADRSEASFSAGRRASRIGSAAGLDPDGRRFRVEYAIVELRGEKVVARYLGPADAVAFNLGLLRRSLRSLEAGQLLVSPLPRSQAVLPAFALETAGFPNGDGAVLVPGTWIREPAVGAGCAALPVAEAGLLLRHPSDYTLVLRALRYPASGSGLSRGLAECGARGDGAASGRRKPYAYQFARLGVEVAVRGVLLEGARETLLLELEAPVARRVTVDELFSGWVERIAAGQ